MSWERGAYRGQADEGRSYGGWGTGGNGEYSAEQGNYGGQYGEGLAAYYRERGPGIHAGTGPKGYRRSDDRIHDDVCDRLMEHGGIDASNIEVSVQNGEVTLSGVVEDRLQKRMAGDAADSVNGVLDVHNHLRLEAARGG